MEKMSPDARKSKNDIILPEGSTHSETDIFTKTVISAQNRSLVVQVGGDTAIINAMFKYPQNSLLQQRGLGTLCNLCIGSGMFSNF